jgi:hypothetical protein
MPVMEKSCSLSKEEKYGTYISSNLILYECNTVFLKFFINNNKKKMNIIY